MQYFGICFFKDFCKEATSLAYDPKKCQNVNFDEVLGPLIPPPIAKVREDRNFKHAYLRIMILCL
jgi:hypothetical protein